MKCNILLCCLLWTCWGTAQNVFFIDAGLKAKLLASNTTDNAIAFGQDYSAIAIDANSDGEIQMSEAVAVYRLYLYMSNLSDTTGMSAFSNLRELTISQSPLTVFDASEYPNLQRLTIADTNVTTLFLGSQLEYLSCANNALTELDLSGSPMLTTLQCANNQLSQLDLTQVVALKSLTCSHNQLDELDISGLSDLEFLDCSYNSIATLDVEGKAKLMWLACGHNNIGALDVTGLAAEHQAGFPVWLDVSYNQLISIDLSVMQGLPVRLICDYNPELLDINAKTGILFFDQINNEPPLPGPTLFFEGTPNLQYLCVDDFNTGFIEEKINNYAYTDVTLNAFCDDVLPIPDAVFKARLLASSSTNDTATDPYGNYFAIDTNQDGEVQRGEVWKLKSLRVNQTATTPDADKIADLSGMELFPNMTSIQFNYNKLTSIDVSNMAKLRGMSCSHNQLTSIHWAQTLQGLNCAYNQITYLAPTELQSLRSIDCSYNQLQTLSFQGSGNEFIVLFCHHNQLTSLELPDMGTFAWFDCSFNQLPYLDLTPLGPIGEYDAYALIDVSDNPMTVLRACTPYPYYAEIDLGNLPNLTQIFALPVNTSIFNFEITQHQLTGCTVNNDCALNMDSQPLRQPSVYPNPVAEVLWLDVSEAQATRFEIVDVAGQRLMERRYSRSGIDVSGLAAGTYFIRVMTDDRVITAKFLKK